MKNESKHFTDWYTGSLALTFSLVTSGYWILGNIINPYTYKIVGAIYELLSIFMVLLLFIIPVASLIGLIVKKFKNSYFYLISVLLSIGTFIWLQFFL